MFLKDIRSKKIIANSYYYKGGTTHNTQDAQLNLKRSGTRKYASEEKKEVDNEADKKKYESMEFLLSGSRDKTIRLWDCTNKQSLVSN